MTASLVTENTNGYPLTVAKDFETVTPALTDER